MHFINLFIKSLFKWLGINVIFALAVYIITAIKLAVINKPVSESR